MYRRRCCALKSISFVTGERPLNYKLIYIYTTYLHIYICVYVYIYIPSIYTYLTMYIDRSRCCASSASLP